MDPLLPAASSPGPKVITFEEQMSSRCSCPAHFVGGVKQMGQRPGKGQEQASGWRVPHVSFSESGKAAGR